ncbi:diacylglycerol kinase [Roseovarius sp. MMSF_3305]|uniref:diacylglycerol kinase n=1 Tax=Roseovarius sp. MMSF_3305 TaxID=3046697 RepID=UPI0027400D95|nr:diacylglycerol kinase [Roseovarius sp. MMSF_3305]
MGNQPLKGVARLIAAFHNSVAGFGDVWRGEEAFRLEVIIFVLSIPAAFWLGSSIFSVVLLIVSVLLVVIVEVLNSAIEAVVDRIGPERHELSRVAKDLGSLAVLLSMLVPGIVWSGALYAKLSGQAF